MALFIGLLLAYFLVPAGLQVVLVRWFWRLSKPAADPGWAAPYWVGWLKLTALAAASCLLTYGWILLFITQLGGSAHGPSLHAADAHERLLPLLGWGGLVVAALLLAARSGQFRPALSFASGLLLVLAGTSSVWYVTQHEKRQRQQWQNEFREHEGTGWQAAAVDSFTRRKFSGRERLVSEVAFIEQEPEFPGGELALAQAVRQRVRPPVGVKRKSGVISVEYVVEPSGRLTMVHVTYGLGAGYDEEAVRVVRSLPPFRPGCDRGEPVAVIGWVNVPFGQ